MNSIQLFGGQTRQFEPLRLNSTAVEYNFRGTDFLAFNKPLSSQPVVEFAHGEQHSKMPYSWEGIWPGMLKVRQTDPMLTSTFAKPGVFNFRYKDVANPIAYGSDFQYDFGAGRPGPGVKAAERLMGDGGNVDDPMPPPARRQMIFTEKYASGTTRASDFDGGHEKPIEDYLLPNVWPKASSIVNPPEHAYDTYGYRETANWKPKSGTSSRAEKTRVMHDDGNACGPDDMWLNGQCFSAGKAVVASCPPGWRYHDDGQCHRNTETSLSLPASSSTLVLERNTASLEDITKKRCPPGWGMKNGECVTKGQVRNLHF